MAQNVPAPPVTDEVRPADRDEFDFFFDDDDGASLKAEQTAASLIDTEQKLGAMLEVMPIGVLIHTAQGIVFANREACGLLEMDKGEIRGRHFLDFVRQTEQEQAAGLFNGAMLGDGEVLEGEAVLRCVDGSEKVVRLTSGRLPWPGNPVVQLLLQDVTAQKRAENSLRQLAIIDELTGAYNRRHLFYEGGLYIENHPANGLPVSVVMLDIDHFKSINDRYGHAIGDVALRALVETGHKFVPTIHGTDSGMLARIGGEEFVMLLPGIDIEAATAAAEKLRRRIARIGVDTGAPEFLRFTASLGVAAYRDGDTSLEELLHRADTALYRAKQTGRNKVCVAA